MSAEPAAAARSNHRLRADKPVQGLVLSPERARRAAPWLILAALAGGFVLTGGGNLDLGPLEARIGLSAAEPLGPFGQMYGGWEPAVWPAQVAPSALWAWAEGGYYPAAASVRWPSAIAGVLAGLILARRAGKALGVAASLWVGLCWFSSLALIDRSAGAGLDLVAGLGVLAALDRLVSRGSDGYAGLWCALAFLAGGWPPVALILLATVVIGRHEARLTPRLLVPPLVAAALWSAWALRAAPAEAWATALTLPLTQRPAWLLPLGVLALGLPWSPFVVLALSRAVREGWPAPGRTLVFGWLQVAGASLLVGTVVPGLAAAARLPALAGLAVAAGACLERLWTGTASRGARTAFLALTAALAGLWLCLAVIGGIYVAWAVPYYRGVMIVLIVLAVPTFLLTVSAVQSAQCRHGLVALVLVAACLKLAHWGFYVPEWNYRFSQGPWGRAIGQWILPRWPVYTTHAWPADLALAIGRPLRQVSDPQFLPYQSKIEPKFVLLLDTEFANWPAAAPPLTPVARFQDERGATRILARTPGDASWHRLSQLSREE
ncbi:MAG: hypothetical protein P4L84_20400 [Isosphaeraceae bacterium]|nr:hypothetical protein [Isosphaeraceae bacterium]